MAHILPSGWNEVAVTGAALREIDTLRLLDRAFADLPYIIYHGVHWTQIEHGFSAYGDVDFILVAPSGRVLLIEQKAGFLKETPEGLVKSWQGREKSVHSAIQRTVQALQARFGQAGHALDIDYLFYCPDYQVKQPLAAGVHPDRIIDAGSKARLTATIRALLPLGEPSAELGRVQRFFGDILQLRPDPNTMIGRADQLVTRLSAGLATWARRLAFSPFRLHIIATAGSGKTQLALAEFQAAIDAGQTPLYVCFNRPLADHMQEITRHMRGRPEGKSGDSGGSHGGRVASFHHLCDTFARRAGKVPDYTGPEGWQALEATLREAPIPEDWRHDVLIVDEGQDFSPAWRDALLRLLKPEGRAIWLEDPLQNLYDRPPVPLEGWVTLHARTNYRSPREIVELLATIGDAAGIPALREIEAASPFLGADIELLTFPDGDTEAMLERTRHAVTGCLGAGFTRSDIAVLSFRGREQSTLLHRDTLGAHRLISFTGAYDLFGNPVFRDGDLLAESVYRFKGQSAPAVIFTEIDAQQLDDKTCRKLFVGMTRARLKLTLVVSERTARLLPPL